MYQRNISLFINNHFILIHGHCGPEDGQKTTRKQQTVIGTPVHCVAPFTHTFTPSGNVTLPVNLLACFWTTKKQTKQKH